MDVKFDMSTRQKVNFSCLQAVHTRNFLLVISINGLGRHMSQVEYHSILKYRLIIPLFPVD